MTTGARKGRSRLCALNACGGNTAAQIKPLPPKRKITLARFGAPHGVRGLMRLNLFSRQADFFLNCKTWWCKPPDADGNAADWQAMTVERCFFHSGQQLVKLAAVDDRDAAAAWCHGLAAMEYDQLPALEEDAFYWCDLIGMQVDNTAGEVLGQVAEVMDIGAHDVLCVRDEDGGQLLIPFVDKHILTVDMQQRRIQADWQRDW